MTERRPFEIRVAGRELCLELGKCACVLFRESQDVDYLAIDISEEGEDRTLRVFNNVEMVRWLAGLALQPDGTPYQVTMNGDLFRDEYGWNPATVIKQHPTEDELEWYLDVNTRDIDKEWGDGIE